MSGEKKRHRWKQNPILIEENIIIDSKLTTITTKIEEKEEKHIENTRYQWCHQNTTDNDNNEKISTKKNISSNETITEKIERVLRKINAWTNETSSSSTATNHNNTTIQRESLQDISFNKTNLSTDYDNICQGQKKSESHLPKSVLNSFRQRCCSSTYNNTDIDMVKNEPISSHRPHSMIYVDDPLPPMACGLTKDKNNYFYDEGQDRKVREINRLSI